ncbi:hypothetical protein [Marilutibacter alkalisoli]|nr:hypothetical protein [Lysobacter alkalisoli]
MAWPLAGAALAYGSWLAWVEFRRPGFELVVTGNDSIRIDGRPVETFRLVWRGPLGFMSWRQSEGRMQRRLWLPDTLPAPTRRELRLALMRAEPAREAGSVAP